jgi:phage protein D
VLQQARAEAECRSAEQKKAMLEERLEQGVHDMGADVADEGEPDVARENDIQIQVRKDNFSPPQIQCIG